VRIRLNAIIALAGVLALLAVAPADALAQRGGRGAEPEAGPTPRLPSGKPDLTGHWTEPYTPNMAGRGGSSVLDPETREELDWPRKGEVLTDAVDPNRTFDLPYTELGLQRWKEYDPVSNGDYAGSCMPFGMARNINSPHGLYMVHNDAALAILFEQNTWFHLIPIGETWEWPDDIPPAWNGYSDGRWEDDTLVIETGNFNGYTKLDTNGHPHSSGVRMINTLTRLDERRIEHTFTVIDPKMYTMPWMNVRTWTLKESPDVLMEYSCEENNQGLFDGSITPWRIPDEVD
jgi:hypothetical protein